MASYQTLAAPCEAVLREKASRFLAFVFPVQDQDEAETHLERLKKEYYDSRHVCFAWRLGSRGENWRAYDAGEPAHSAGDPILNALRSRELTHVLGVVIRYFGGTKLGIPGLIEAYREATLAALDQGTVITVHPMRSFQIRYGYERTAEVNKALHHSRATVAASEFGADCFQTLQVPEEDFAIVLEIFRTLGILA